MGIVLRYSWKINPKWHLVPLHFMLCNAFKPLKRNLCICHEDVVSSWGKWYMKWAKRSREGSCVISCLSALISPLMSWRWDREEEEKNSIYAASCGNVPVQGPEICFPKHASCDFTRHCLAQHPASCFLENFMWEPRTLSPSRFALFRLFLCSPSASLLIQIMWTTKAHGVWPKI